eukprot:3932131-Rhodomonas_salina.1
MPGTGVAYAAMRAICDVRYWCTACFDTLGKAVDFYTWRSLQLHLVVAMARVGLGVKNKGEAKEEEDVAEGVARWKVAEETKEYTSPQLMQ